MTRRSSADLARRAAVALAAAIAVAATPAHAEAPRDPALAESLFRSAQEALARGDFATACPKFRASMAAEPAVSTWLNIAKCDLHDGKLARAWADYQGALVLNRETVGDKRRQELEEYARRALAALEPRLPRLRVTVVDPPSGLAVVRDGVPMDAGALGEAVPVDPGPHRVEITAPGHRRATFDVTLVEGRTAHVDARLEPAPAPAPAPAAPPPPPAEPARVPTWAWVAGGVGVAAAAVGVGFAVDGASTVGRLYDRCPAGADGRTPTCPPGTDMADIDPLNARKNRDLAIGLAFDVVGAAGLVAFAVGVATSRSPARDRGARPVLIVGRGGVGLGGAF